MLRELAWITAVLFVVVTVTLVWHRSVWPASRHAVAVSHPTVAELRRSIEPTRYP